MSISAQQYLQQQKGRRQKPASPKARLVWTSVSSTKNPKRGEG